MMGWRIGLVAIAAAFLLLSSRFYFLFIHVVLTLSLSHHSFPFTSPPPNSMPLQIFLFIYLRFFFLSLSRYVFFLLPPSLPLSQFCIILRCHVGKSGRREQDWSEARWCRVVREQGVRCSVAAAACRHCPRLPNKVMKRKLHVYPCLFLHLIIALHINTYFIVIFLSACLPLEVLHCRQMPSGRRVY